MQPLEQILSPGDRPEASFPCALGPFAILQTKLQTGDLQPQQHPAEDRHTVWLLHKETIQQHGIQCGVNATFPLMGQFSPAHSITLAAREKVALGIPAKATSFVWSYPVSGWTCVSEDQSPIANFLALGGYVYFDSMGEILRCNTLTKTTQSSGGGLQFGSAQHWQEEWTASLLKEGRFQPVTIQAMYDAGARYFCWLRPEEKMAGNCKEQPEVPHGGFVYLFHDDPAAQNSSDCYFAIASGDDYKHRDPVLESSRSCSFSWQQLLQNASQNGIQLVKQDPHVKQGPHVKQDPRVKQDSTIATAPPELIVGKTISPGDSDVPVLVRIDAFPTLGQRAPADICCILDISGSMGMEASIQDAAGRTESHGLSLLDVAKHAVRTIIHSISSQDRLSIVCFDHIGEVVLPLTLMNSSAQEDAEAKLDKLQVRGGTNIWAGLEKGLQTLNSGGLSNFFRQDRMQHVLLLTDGQDGYSRPTEELQKYLQQNKSSQLTVSTFGFGYGISSELLVQLAKTGGGSYAFIPDAGFVGTVFVNAISNLLVTATSSAYLELMPGTGVKIMRVSGVETDAVDKQMSGSVRVNIGTLQLGQARDVVVYITATSRYLTSEACLTAQVGFTCPVKGPSLSAAGQAFPAHTDDMQQVEPQVHRCDVVETLGNVLQGGVSARAESLQMVQQLSNRIRSSASASDSFVAALLEDVEGEVFTAVSDHGSLSRWGVHYLPSLMFAHKFQQCNNFKDPGVQMYGGDVFNEIRDLADENFNELPPPKPSVARANYSSSSTSYAPINMSAYNNAYAG